MLPDQVGRKFVQHAPIPDWVDHQPYRSDLSDMGTSCVVNGLGRLLSDVQVNLNYPEQAWHCRTVQRVLTREGAERAAHFVAEFDPGFQHIEVHCVRVIRGDECIEHAKPGAFQLLQRETNLERLIFDGHLTASMLIPDVRVDDLVEIVVTIYGAVPSLNGQYVAWVVFDAFNPWFDVRQRLLKPFDRQISVKTYNNPPASTVSTNGTVEDMRWQIIGRQRDEPEGLTPSWVLHHPALQFSEFENWEEVSSLLLPHYESDGLPDSLAELVDNLAVAHATFEARAIEWFRFVQRELRYFAFSLGEGGLTPRTLDTIWGTRFGDCKDAARLFVAGGRRLGLDVCAALVSTTHGPVLDEFLASTGAFNHCIVRLRFNGKTYWLDPTASGQGGTLDNVFQSASGWALPLTAQTDRLERISDQEVPHVAHWEDEIVIGPKRESPAIVRRHIDYSFWAADAVRSRIANQGKDEFAQALIKGLPSTWTGVTAVAPMEMHDDKDRNSISVSLVYEVRNVWRADKEVASRLIFDIGFAISRELELLPDLSRRDDIYLGLPRKLTSRVLVEMPRKWLGDGWSKRLEMSNATYLETFAIQRRMMTISRELVIDARSASAAEIPEYNAIARQLQADLLMIWARVRFGRIRPWLEFRARVLIALRAIGFSVWGLSLLYMVLRALLVPHR